MPRRRQDGKKPQRHQAKAKRLRELIPRVGFDLADKKCRAKLSGVDSAKVKEHIRAFTRDLNKSLVDQALTSIFEPAIAAMKQDPEKIADTTPGEYWGLVRREIPWIRDSDLTSHAIYELVVALIIAHEKYDEAYPYDRYKHQYGALARAVHEFAQLLKQHHESNFLIMGTYFNSAMSLPSDDEEEDEEEEEEGGGEGGEEEEGDEERLMRRVRGMDISEACGSGAMDLD
ncbi:uncharacterized protein F4822DRAFT_126056 [Hypoxylon trugodes]|uniref:uncharacterized protein n=1 Tax=Hypoxylon trugodes TaxID=326681 RepID=UPI002193C852|nr:uncharacterized protein F4822DRAFT_126056 [Hypoxylon trugodes]KAI1392336.1 hypothetical protein F4822DRAFT_126056 [Hypoxylon trugodes]